MNDASLTRLAILGTVSDLHRQPITYDLACLRQILLEQAPDLVCAEITTEAWEQGDFSTTVLEVREALAPVAAVTDIVLVPVAPTMKRYEEFAANASWSQRATQSGIRLLRWAQRKAATPRAINSPIFGLVCHTVCALTESSWPTEQRFEWERQNKDMAENIMRVIRRDPGRRILVVVQCQRIHLLVPLLKALTKELELVQYHTL